MLSCISDEQLHNSIVSVGIFDKGLFNISIFSIILTDATFQYLVLFWQMLHCHLKRRIVKFMEIDTFEVLKYIAATLHMSCPKLFQVAALRQCELISWQNYSMMSLSADAVTLLVMLFSFQFMPVTFVRPYVLQLTWSWLYPLHHNFRYIEFLELCIPPISQNCFKNSKSTLSLFYLYIYRKSEITGHWQQTNFYSRCAM